MKQNENGAVIASTVVDAINEFYGIWYSYSSLYKNVAMAYAELYNIVSKYDLCKEEVKSIKRVLDQSMMQTDLIESLRIGETYEQGTRK